jgi:2-dehydro-3-deoxyphosphogluconate aldolase / (4S)-4-hydroxy-2-oxoglutarate aldolase
MHTIISQIISQGVLPLYFHKDREVSANILRALYRAGVRVVEYTNRGEEAADNFAYLKEISDKEMKGMKLGAGTIKTSDDAEEFIDAGADFLISPGWNKRIAKKAAYKNMLWVPGCMTPTEIMKAEEYGAELVKLFPGSVLGPGFVSAIKELFPHLLFIPTGGVKIEESNLRAWFAGGVCAVGAGSTLISKKSVEEGDFSEIEIAVKNALDMVRSIK